MDFNDNAFSGTVPSQLFDLPNLEALSLAKNCFSGGFPTTTCGAKSLKILDLDGLRSSQACIRSSSFLTDIADTFNIVPIYSSKYLKGPLPECLFQLSNLTALYASGNGISGILLIILYYY